MQSRKILGSVFELVKTVAFVFLIAFIIRSFIIQSFRVEGSSMEPNFHNGQFVLVEKISYRVTDPKPVEVIVLETPEQPNVDFIKRIIGRPGDTIDIRNNQVFINNNSLVEPYLPISTVTQINGNLNQEFSAKLADGEYFVMGDNRQSSKDSRSIGAIPRQNIIGKVFFILWPLDRFGLAARAF